MFVLGLVVIVASLVLIFDCVITVICIKEVIDGIKQGESKPMIMQGVLYTVIMLAITIFIGFIYYDLWRVLIWTS